MSTLTLRLLLLVIHISGLVLIAGTTITGFVVFRAFISKAKTIHELSTSLLKLLGDLAATFRLGGILLVLSGTGLMWVTGGIFLHQVWLQIKLSLILLLILNEVLIGKREIKKLNSSLSETNIDAVIRTAVPRLNMFYAAQLLLFLAIISLAVFKVN